MRPLFIAGNWKMNPTTEADAVALAEAVKAGVGQDHAVRVALCPPSVYLHRLDAALSNSPIGVGAQNMHPEGSGAFTGELSAPMLVDVGCTHVILGHSERRHGLGETDAFINQKLHAALKSRLIPIVCIGETLEEREQGRTEEVVASQLEGSLAGLADLADDGDDAEADDTEDEADDEDGDDAEAGGISDRMAGVVLAYEPVWAIGTGRTATPEQAQEVHAFIRSRLASAFSEAIAARVVIQYGGSVKPDNARDLLARPDIDGALVGGASLKAADFLGIIDAARSVTRDGKG